jgi:hypothetical protein
VTYAPELPPVHERHHRPRQAPNRTTPAADEIVSALEKNGLTSSSGARCSRLPTE